MSAEVHAYLSASGSSRWLKCPASVKLEQGFPQSTSVYAEEGTKAHALAEIILKGTLGDKPLPPFQLNRDIFDHLKALPEDQGKEMRTAVQHYVDTVTEKYAAVKGKGILIIEGKLDFSPWVPKGFGTGDAVIIAEDSLEIIDLKYGKGVPVSAEGNSQMRLYALGAYHVFSMLYDFSKITMTIVQPRLDSVSSETISIDELLKWGETVKPVAKLAYEGKGSYCPGDACRFCRAKGACKALADHELEVAKYEFRSPDMLTLDDIADILEREKMFVEWIKGVSAYALDMAVNHGFKYPGFKLVEGRSNRIIREPEKVETALRNDGLRDAEIYKPLELNTLTALEKIVGKKHFDEICGSFIAKPEGKPTLVKDTDKRPLWSSASKDFQ